MVCTNNINTNVCVWVCVFMCAPCLWIDVVLCMSLALCVVGIACAFKMDGYMEDMDKECGGERWWVFV